MLPHEIITLFEAVSSALRSALSAMVLNEDPGDREGQYSLDLVADELVVKPLLQAGLAVLSEESGLQVNGSHSGEVDQDSQSITVVVDPVDGSTNASLGIPFYAVSLCAVDEEGPLVALVSNLATGDTYFAQRGKGAFRRSGQGDGNEAVGLTVRHTTQLADSIVCINGLTSRHLGWKQFRALGAASLELCLIADGAVDAYLNSVPNSHGSWDYLAGMLIVSEAGGTVVDLEGRDLVAMNHTDRRTVVAACSDSLSTEVVSALKSDVENSGGD